MRSLIRAWASKRLLAAIRELEFENIRLRARLARADEDRQILERQRETLIDILDRLKWEERALAADAVSHVNRVGVADQGKA